MSNQELDELRLRLDEINLQILQLINERAEIVQEIGHLKEKQGTKRFDPVREREMLDKIVAHNHGPFDDNVVRHLFKEIFKASLELQEEDKNKQLLVSRKRHPEDTIVKVGDVEVGRKPVMIAGPCSVETEEQVDTVAKGLAEQGIKLIRGGAFKPRTSPYDFQGLGIEGLKILKKVADRYGLKVVSEIVNPADIEMATQYVDVIQLGARNMQNFELLKAAGQIKTPVLLKRGLAATIEEFLFAAEYIVSRGNNQVILVERGIRTYEKWTRNTLDILAVPILKQESHLPVLVDISHSAGRKDIAIPIAKAALAAGADGIMVEVHPDPAVALSDANQQLNLDQFNELMTALKGSQLL
ncbi:bifunctional 3-deoxy-7-phosphoheptulonate synthase/chorismate mutase [Tepidibacillus sp. HK-1]|uniref:bifunctional 3-deoxy-7-phosphoheptulonate synthase/chorismate mutase n=1 Tax=Tepidibacillus sp. HK-1 TaxID=1883407 RepID=UPI000853728B|nr:bifunctional 3-deoxy-7-phosphoheptulonate synthase/chorismate mutase [Tepidibacillus sp. HK-1]GBF10391.1 phospho-2-dehydro-3-deoxyheptonate aldolase [Tepidibacillus sp. HK-1]